MTLSTRGQIIVGFVLALLVVATRGQHSAAVHSLPGASWAAFFLAGVYLRSLWALPGLLALTWVLDFAAYAGGGASDYCLTPAYLFLLPAYGALWLAGRWYVRRHDLAWRTLLPLVAATVAGAALCEVFSSGGFYFFSGHFADPTLAEFSVRVMTYFPGYLQSLAFYVTATAVLHVLLRLASVAARARKATVA